MCGYVRMCVVQVHLRVRRCTYTCAWPASGRPPAGRSRFENIQKEGGGGLFGTSPESGSPKSRTPDPIAGTTGTTGAPLGTTWILGISRILVRRPLLLPPQRLRRRGLHDSLNGCVVPSKGIPSEGIEKRCAGEEQNGMWCTGMQTVSRWRK